MCSNAEEDLDHLLLHCPSVRGLWVALTSIPCLQWVLPLFGEGPATNLEWGFPLGRESQKGVESCTSKPNLGYLEGKKQSGL